MKLGKDKTNKEKDSGKISAIIALIAALISVLVSFYPFALGDYNKPISEKDEKIEDRKSVV